jgi:hypothetical protein
MQLIITQRAETAHANPDAAARQRSDRLAQATIDQMQKALAFLSVIDPEAFEIAFTAVTPATDGQPGDEEPVPVCRACGAQEIYDPGYSPDVTWCLPTDSPEDL